MDSTNAEDATRREGSALQRQVRPGTGPRTAAAMTATLDACGRLGPEHAALVECCRELERDLAAERERHHLRFAGWFREVPSGMSYRLWEQGGHEQRPGDVALYELA